MAVGEIVILAEGVGVHVAVGDGDGLMVAVGLFGGGGLVSMQK